MLVVQDPRRTSQKMTTTPQEVFSDVDASSVGTGVVPTTSPMMPTPKYRPSSTPPSSRISRGRSRSISELEGRVAGLAPRDRLRARSGSSLQNIAVGGSSISGGPIPSQVGESRGWPPVTPPSLREGGAGIGGGSITEAGVYVTMSQS